MRSLLNRFNVRVSMVYCLVATLWIVISDTLFMSLLWDDLALLQNISTLKGLSFVGVTSLILFGVMTVELRKRIQVEQLLQQERDMSPVGLVTFKPTGEIYYANAQAERVLGLTRSMIIGQIYNAPLWCITDYEGNSLSDDDLPFAQVARTCHAIYGIQHAFEWPDGKRVLLEINAAPVFDTAGVLLEVLTSFNDVTILQTQTTLLRENEERYRLLVEESPYAIGVHQAWELVFANSATARLLGAAGVDDLMGKPISTIVHPETWIAAQDRIERMLQGETGLYPTEERYVRLDGSTIHVELTAAPFKYRGKTALQIIALDITKRKEAEAALRESETHHRLLVEQAADGIFVVDQQGHYIQVNQRGCEMLGYTCEELLLLRLQDLIVAEDLVSDLFQIEVLSSGQVLTSERQLRCKDNNLLSVEISLRMLPHGRLQGIIHDLTHRKQAEEHILYQANLIESISDAIIATDLKFVIRSWNRAAETLYGWSAHEVIGQKIIEILPTSYSGTNTDAVLAQFQQEGLWKGEAIQLHRNGTPIHLLSAVSLTYDSSGVSVGVVSINRNINERKRAELALQRYNQHLTIMRQIDRDIISAHSAEAITETVLKHIRHLIACERASVILYDDSAATAVILGIDLDLAERSVFQTYPRVSVIHNQNFELLESGKVLIIPDLRLDGLTTTFAQYAIQEGIRATLSAPLLIQEKLIGHLSLASTKPNFFHSEHAEVASEIANQLAVAFHNTRLLQDIKTKNQRLQTLSARLVEAQEVERRHIARELHDEVGQMLTALSLMLAMQARQSTSGGSIDLAESQMLVGDLMKRVRDLSLDLRPSMLDDLGLIPALVWYFKRYEHQTEVMIDFKHRNVEYRYSPIIETTLYRIIQEALTNVARYAQVKRVSVVLWATPDAIHAQIEDDGIGFDLEAVQAANKTGGLIGLHERAQLAGGTCEIESSASAGTIVTARILLPSENLGSV